MPTHRLRFSSLIHGSMYFQDGCRIFYYSRGIPNLAFVSNANLLSIVNSCFCLVFLEVVLRKE